MKDSLKEYLEQIQQEIGRQICGFLQLQEEDSLYDFNENSPYTESILSREVKQYFSDFGTDDGRQENAESLEGNGCMLCQMMDAFELDSFERWCVELVLLGEINPFFEKFFVYMNNDWNHGFLTPELSIRLFNMSREVEISYYRYFRQARNLMTHFLDFGGQEGKSRARWGLRCKEHFFQYIFSNEDTNFKKEKERYIWENEEQSSPLVTLVDNGFCWDDLVLPDKQKTKLQTACNRVLYRDRIYCDWGFGRKMPYGRGVSMVFSGPPGTGKTMSAAVVADYLDTVLYRVNLAAVVSKYIGETEKNLSSVFKTVKRKQGVLFFDEADVLFSKRTEVNNSHDKHSNMEAAFLLQKMEEYEGVVILATNYARNMDEAFKRRIPFWIDFSLPDEEGRRQLWEKVFPSELQFEEQPDYDFLAKHFDLSGSHIKNIALQAAFFAADEGKGVNMEHIIRALLLEVRKTGKSISREDLQQYYIYYE